MGNYETNYSTVRFFTLNEAKILIERWRVYYNTIRHHSSLRFASLTGIFDIKHDSFMMKNIQD